MISALSRKAKALIISSVTSFIMAFGGFLLIIIIIMVMAGGKNEIIQQQQDNIADDKFSDAVMAYENVVIEECVNQDIEDYISVILAMMQILTGGDGQDPMKATYKETNLKYKPEAGMKITDPEYSIKAGVEEVAWLIEKIKIKSPQETDKLRLIFASYITDRKVLNYMPTYNEEKFQNYIIKNGFDKQGAYVGFPEEVINLIMGVGDGSVNTGSGFIWPLPSQYKTLSSKFGYRNCPFHGQELHPGIDIPAPMGTSIYASKSGTVTVAKYHYSFGNYCVIDHGDGTKTQYNHTSQLLVKVGQTVTQGEVIAKVGSTGSSTGAHLDFRIIINGKEVDPIPQINNNQSGTGSGNGLKYTAEELDIVSKLLCREAGATWASDEHQRLVVSVIVNRVKSPLFPNTIKGVIYQPGQYAPAGSGYIENARPDKRTIANAKYVLDNGSICPSNVLYQANFKQGSGVYKAIYDEILGTTTYFCYQ